MGKVKDYYWDEINESEPEMDTELENEYAEKLGIIMGQFLNDKLDQVEYEIELERLEEWYQEQSKAQR